MSSFATIAEPITTTELQRHLAAEFARQEGFEGIEAAERTAALSAETYSTFAAIAVDFFRQAFPTLPISSQQERSI